MPEAQNQGVGLEQGGMELVRDRDVVVQM